MKKTEGEREADGGKGKVENHPELFFSATVCWHLCVGGGTRKRRAGPEDVVSLCINFVCGPVSLLVPSFCVHCNMFLFKRKDPFFGGCTQQPRPLFRLGYRTQNIDNH